MGKPKITMICESCGSLDVTADACARWDDDAQDWIATSVYDNTDCQSCGGECRTDERPIGFDPFSEAFDMDRIEMLMEDGAITLTHYPPDTVRRAGVRLGIITDEQEQDYFKRDARARDLANSLAKTLTGCVSIIEREAT